MFGRQHNKCCAKVSIGSGSKTTNRTKLAIDSVTGFLPASARFGFDSPRLRAVGSPSTSATYRHYWIGNSDSGLFPDQVFLHLQNPGRPFEALQIFKQPIGVGCDPEDPLRQ